MTKTKEPNWGGPRKGAGRPRVEDPRCHYVMIRVNAEEWNLLAEAELTSAPIVRPILLNLAKRKLGAK